MSRMGLVQHRLAQIVGVACICTFLASLFFHLFICYPVKKTWQIKPYAGGELSSIPKATSHELTENKKTTAQSAPSTTSSSKHLASCTLSLSVALCPILSSLTLNPVQNRLRRHEHPNSPRPRCPHPQHAKDFPRRTLLLRNIRHDRCISTRLLLR